MSSNSTGSVNYVSAIKDEKTLDSFITTAAVDIENSMLGFQLRKLANNEASKTGVSVTDLAQQVKLTITNSTLERRLRNTVVQKLMTYTPPPHHLTPKESIKEPVSYIRKAREQWEKRVIKSINSMCTELNVSLARRRTDREQKEFSNKWTELGANELDLSKFRPVYAAKDLLDVISGIRSPNYVYSTGDSTFTAFWGLVQLPLVIKTLHDLRAEFAEMSINQSQAGVDDSKLIPTELFAADREKLAALVIKNHESCVAREYGKCGCPLGLRATLWKLMLNVEVDDIDRSYYEELKIRVFQHDLLMDSLTFKDVKLTATNDDQYFVFEDYLYQILLTFSRDSVVLKHFLCSQASPPESYIRGKYGSEEYKVYYPPNGVVPFHGFSMFVAPLCFIYNDPVTLYYVFRAMYMRYFFHLHTLSSHPQGIISLCLLFETLLQASEPRMFLHMNSIGVPPLKIAFKWLMRAFSGYLSTEQTLLLWDRIIAYDSLDLLPVLAAAIFSFRKINLMQVQTLNAAEAVMADLMILEVIPLIQLFLFSQ